MLGSLEQECGFLVVEGRFFVARFRASYHFLPQEDISTSLNFQAYFYTHQLYSSPSLATCVKLYRPPWVRPYLLSTGPPSTGD